MNEAAKSLETYALSEGQPHHHARLLNTALIGATFQEIEKRCDQSKLLYPDGGDASLADDIQVLISTARRVGRQNLKVEA
jgi:hypothetical protein